MNECQSHCWTEGRCFFLLTYWRCFLITNILPHCYCSLFTNFCPTPLWLWTVPCQVPLSKGFFRQKYWDGLLFPSPRDLPDTGIKPMFPALKENSLQLSHQGSPSKFFLALSLHRPLSQPFLLALPSVWLISDLSCLLSVSVLPLSRPLTAPATISSARCCV